MIRRPELCRARTAVTTLNSDLAFTSKGKTWQSMMVPPHKPNP
jgi:hypothetical protein